MTSPKLPIGGGVIQNPMAMAQQALFDAPSLAARRNRPIPAQAHHPAPHGKRPRMAGETISCSGCGSRWGGVSRCHCASCHRTFGGLALFDAHRASGGERGACLDPAGMRVRSGARAGQPVMFLRDGIWSGPEMDEETKAARFGGAA